MQQAPTRTAGRAFFSRVSTLLAGLAMGAALALAGGCAVVPPHESASDPLQPLNRVVFKFNDKVDQYALEPVARFYQEHTPSPVRTGVRNFFNNLEEPLVVINDLLQAKFTQAASDSVRFLFNTTFGIVGLIDVATPMGHPKHDEDFGQTLGVWGIGEGWYIVLPLLGPSTIRDAAGLPFEWEVDPVQHIDGNETRVAMIAVRVVDSRAQLLTASRILETAAIDPYFYTQDAYRQLRWSRIHDGNPPQATFNDE